MHPEIPVIVVGSCCKALYRNSGLQNTGCGSCRLIGLLRRSNRRQAIPKQRGRACLMELGKPVACNHGLLSINQGLLYGIVTIIVVCYFGLLG